jgi:hypothetical protein
MDKEEIKNKKKEIVKDSEKVAFSRGSKDLKSKNYTVDEESEFEFSGTSFGVDHKKTRFAEFKDYASDKDDAMVINHVSKLVAADDKVLKDKTPYALSAINRIKFMTDQGYSKSDISDFNVMLSDNFGDVAEFSNTDNGHNVFIVLGSREAGSFHISSKTTV